MIEKKLNLHWMILEFSDYDGKKTEWIKLKLLNFTKIIDDLIELFSNVMNETANEEIDEINGEKTEWIKLKLLNFTKIIDDLIELFSNVMNETANEEIDEINGEKKIL